MAGLASMPKGVPEGVTTTRRPRAAAGAVALILGLLALAAPALAQTPGCDNPPDPYSGGNPNCDQQATITITLSLGSGAPGTTVVVDANGFANGDTVTITFGGAALKTATATTSAGGGLAVFRPTHLLALADAALPGRLPGVRAQAASKAAIHEAITVPSVSAGKYDVCVSAPRAQTACAPFSVTTPTEVAGVSFSRGGVSLGRFGGSGLARTGLALLSYLLLAVILILSGRYLVSKSRARRA